MASLGVINKQYVSAVDPMLDTREILKNVTDAYNETRLTDILTLAQRTKPTQQPVFYDFANEGLFKQIDTTGSTITGSGTPTVTITGVTAATSGYNRDNDVVMLQGTTNPTAWVFSVTTTAGQDTIVIKSVTNSNITLTAGTILNSYSIAVGERSASPLNLRYGLTKYSNKVQIFREVSQITDIQNMSTIEVDFNGQPSYLVKDHLDKTIKMKGNINAQFIGGEMSSTSFSDVTPFLVDQNAVTGGGGGGAVQLTRGLNSYTTSYGVVTAAATLGTIGLADLNTMNAALTANRAPLEYTIFGGKAARAVIDTYWKNLGSSGITSARLMVDGTDVNTTVDKTTYGGYTYNFVTLPILDHPTLFGGTLIAKSLYFVPMNAQVPVYNGTTGSDGNLEPAMQIRYMPQPSNYAANWGNGLVGEIQSGALNTVNPTGETAEMKTGWITYQGMQLLGATYFGRMRVLS